MNAQNICPFPGCSNEYVYGGSCGKHQVAIQNLGKVIHHLCQQRDYLICKKSCQQIALAVTPLVFQPETDAKATIDESKPRLKKGLTPSQFTGLMGISDRTTFSILSAGIPVVYEADARLIKTSEAILCYACLQELIPLKAAAESIGTSHRYLRHLVYETKEIQAQAFPFPFQPAKSPAYFWRSELPEIGLAVELRRGGARNGIRNITTARNEIVR